jgi:flagellar protein FlbD
VIRLTRLNNRALTVNSDLIKFVEQSPDTVITLLHGEKIVVLESADEVLARLIAFRRSVLQGLSFPRDSRAWDSSAAHALFSDPSSSDSSFSDSSSYDPSFCDPSAKSSERQKEPEK